VSDGSFPPSLTLPLLSHRALKKIRLSAGNCYSQAVSDPLAYFLTWHTYGTWLPGRAPGSVDAERCEFGTPFIPPDPQEVARNAARLVHPPVTLDQARRMAVQAAVAEVCAFRNWTLLALHIRTTHVHGVVAAAATPEKMLNDFKAYATRRLRREKLAAANLHVWSKHGSTIYLWKADQLAEVVDYVVNRQGAALEPAPLCRFGTNMEP